MVEDVSRLRDTFVAVWNAANPDVTIDVPALTPAEHVRNERELATFVKVLEAESRRARRRVLPGEAGEQRVLGAFARLAVRALGWQRHYFEGGPADGFRESLRTFPVQARRLNPALRAADIYQAARNALTMHCLQALLGVAVESTPAVLGYSLLYPYTDNLLDDSPLDVAAKVAFSRRLADRLHGREVEPAGAREARIFNSSG